MLKYFLILSVTIIQSFALDQNLSIATVDSGFGGYFTAKAIEESAFDLTRQYSVQFKINHYGDTENSPYGEKTPDEIAKFASQSIIKAHLDGAKYVFLACNTASSQFEKIKTILKSKPETETFSDTTFSIIESSIAELKTKIDKLLLKKDHVQVAILATPATLKSDIYPRELQIAFKVKNIIASTNNFMDQKRWYQKNSATVKNGFSIVEFITPTNKKITVYQIAPGNWVEMIEHQASPTEKNSAIKNDLQSLTKTLDKKVQFDLIAEFCTHFPVFHQQIVSFMKNNKRATEKTQYIQQGALFAHKFSTIIAHDFKDNKRMQKLSKKDILTIQKNLVPEIFISGSNQEETQNLVKSIFPKQQNISIKKY